MGHSDRIRTAHFARAQRLIEEGDGFFIKNTGDGVYCVFRNALAAVEFTSALIADTGHEVVRIRAGINVGEVAIAADDAFGHQINLTSRVMGRAPHGGLIATEAVQAAVTQRLGQADERFRWIALPDEPLKGIAELVTLYQVEAR